MYIHSISAFHGAKPNFLQQKRRKDNTDRAVTVQDLYDMEDRINSKIKRQNQKLLEMENRIDSYNENLMTEQNKLLGNALGDITNLIYFRPLASSHDYYKAAQKSSKIVKNNGVQ